MAIREAISSLTPRRKLAAAIAVIWTLVFLTVVLPIALDVPARMWQPVWGVVTVGLSAFSTAIVAVELIRLVLPMRTRWSDAQHFTRVNFLWAVFFGVQVIGYTLMVSSHG